MLHLREATEREQAMWVNEAQREGYGLCSPPTHILVLPNPYQNDPFGLWYTPMCLNERKQIETWHPKQLPKKS